MYVIGRFLIASVLALLVTSAAIRVSTAESESMSVAVVSQTAVPLTPVPVAPFGSVELRGGGKVVIRHGPTQRVALLGSAHYSRITIADGGRLIIEKCEIRCPRGYDLVIEIVTPRIAGISVTDGGTVQSHGRFPRQAEIRLAVSQGGTIDIRSIAVDSVNASVDEGGSIFTMPQTTMFASVVNGGKITYWGDARVKSSVQGGGDVSKGTAAEANKPLSELSPSLPVLTPLPATLPIKPLRTLRA